VFAFYSDGGISRDTHQMSSAVVDDIIRRVSKLDCCWLIFTLTLFIFFNNVIIISFDYFMQQLKLCDKTAIIVNLWVVLIQTRQQAICFVLVYIVSTACIVCRAGFMKVFGFCPSVHPSVCLSYPACGRHMLLRRVCCCGPAGRRWYGMVNVDLYSAIITKVSN